MLPGTLWGIAAYFNPMRYPSKQANYRTFRRASALQGLRLVAVEAAFGDAPFELACDDAEIVVQLRTDTVLWQKERLLNVALRHLPADCDKVVWTDTDILYENEQWVAQCCEKLREYIVVQPFADVVPLPRGCTTPMRNADPGRAADTRWPGTAASWVKSGPDGYTFAGHPGGAVATRRRVAEAAGIYDRMILGGGDSVMMGAFVGIGAFENPFINCHPKVMLSDAASWCRKLMPVVRGSVHHVGGSVFHLWHGSRQKRYYRERASLLDSFDPERDIRVDGRQCWSWSSAKPELHERVRSYFRARDEECEQNATLEELRSTELERQWATQWHRAEALEQELHRERSRVEALRQTFAWKLSARIDRILSPGSRRRCLARSVLRCVRHLRSWL